MLFKGIRFITALLSFLILNNQLQSQTASAELLSSVKPMKLKSGEPLTDGIQNVFLSGNHLFVSNVWGGMQILDVSDVSQPKEIGNFQAERTHNIFVENNSAYLSNELDGVTVLDITNPAAPHEITKIDTEGDAFFVTAAYPVVYVAEESKGIGIYDISDVENPRMVGRYDTPGWAWGLYLVNKTLYVADKTGGVVILDVSDPAQPALLGRCEGTNYAKTVQVIDGVAYVANGPNGLYVLDVSDSGKPKIISKLAVNGFVYNAFKFGNSVFLANETKKRLEIINVTDMRNPLKEGEYQTSGKVYASIKQDVYVYVAADKDLQILRHNHRPQIEQITAQFVDEKQPLTITPKASDPDGDHIYFTVQNLPDSASFDSTSGTITWMPNYDHSGLYPDIKITVWEKTATKLSDETIFNLTVNHVNRNPLLPDVADTSLVENSTITFTLLEGSDEDVEDTGKLTYSATNLPEGASFDAISRTFSWTPNFDQSGVHTVDFAVTDPAGGVERNASTLTVIHVDRKPVLTEVGDHALSENKVFSIKLEGKDLDTEDHDKISYRAENLPEGATFDPLTATFGWTPTHEQSGVYENILFVITAGALHDSVLTTISVEHVNRMPQIVAVDNKSVDEDQLIAFSISGNDLDMEDEGKLSFSAANLPEGAVFVPDSLQFSWKPTFDQANAYENVLFIITDPSGLQDTTSVTFTVNHINRAPTLADIEPKALDENTLLTFDLMGSDPDTEDEGKLVYTVDNLPEGAVLEAQKFSWTPGFTQSGLYTLLFTVSDGRLSESKEMQITVAHVNRPPVLAAIAAQSVNENALLTFQLEGSDPDAEDSGKLHFSAGNLPEGSLFDTTTQTFSWTPTFEQSGKYNLAVTLKDAAGLSVEKSVELTVNHINRTPVLGEQAAQTVAENSLLDIVLIPGSDPDAEDQDKLVYTVEGLPDGMNFDPETLKLSWTPGYDQSGTHSLVVKMKDSEFTVEQALKITVNHINRPPQISAAEAQSLNENEPWAFTLQFSDADEEDAAKLTLSAANLPDGMNFSAVNGSFSWTPGFEQAGTYTIDVNLSDGLETVSSTLTLDVANTNRKPVISGSSAAELMEEESISLSYTAEDADNDDLTFSAENLPSGAELSGSGSFNWIPQAGQAGSHSITVKVSDGNLEDTLNLQVDVTAKPVPQPETAPADTTN